MATKKEMKDEKNAPLPGFLWFVLLVFACIFFFSMYITFKIMN